jgi:hypothetical protein
MREATIATHEPALNVRAVARIWAGTDPAAGATWTCRWAGTPQPITGGRFEVAAIPAGERGEVHQHSPHALDLFLKIDGDPEFYAFFNESYRFQDWRHPGMKFIHWIAL